MQTIRLYEKDIYLRQCTANVIDTVESEKGIFVTLDQTIFYPEGGGQPSDLGMIGDAKVLDVVEEGETLLHQVDRKPSSATVNCQLDWSRRLDNMQQHCGEHILSGVILSRYQGANKGFRMGEDYVTIDIDLPEMSEEMLSTIEKEANQAIYDNVPVLIHKASNRAEAEKYPVRKQVTVDEDVRIVEIQGVDCVACCGSHPRTTGDVGIIKLLKAEKYKGMTRIYFKCGVRALADYRQKHDIVSTLCQQYSSEVDSLLERLKAEDEKAMQMRESYHKLRKQINDLESAKLMESAVNDTIVANLSGFEPDDLAAIAKRLLDQGSYTVLLSTDLSNKVILTHNGDKELHCGKMFKNYIGDYQGRGGGGDRMAQGVFESHDQALLFVDRLKEEL